MENYVHFSLYAIIKSQFKKFELIVLAKRLILKNFYFFNQLHPLVKEVHNCKHFRVFWCFQYFRHPIWQPLFGLYFSLWQTKLFLDSIVILILFHSFDNINYNTLTIVLVRMSKKLDCRNYRRYSFVSKWTYSVDEDSKINNFLSQLILDFFLIKMPPLLFNSDWIITIFFFCKFGDVKSLST